MSLERRTPLKRTPLKSKRSKPRRLLSSRCARQRCNQIARIGELCKKHAMKTALALWAQRVKERDHECLAEQHALFAHVGCYGGLQADHLFPRSTYPSLRLDLENGATLCAAHHLYVTDRWPEHSVLALTVLGVARYQALYARRYAGAPDVGEALLRLAA